MVNILVVLGFLVATSGDVIFDDQVTVRSHLTVIDSMNETMNVPTAKEEKERAKSPQNKPNLNSLTKTVDEPPVRLMRMIAEDEEEDKA